MQHAVTSPANAERLRAVARDEVFGLPLIYSLVTARLGHEPEATWSKLTIRKLVINYVWHNLDFEAIGSAALTPASPGDATCVTVKTTRSTFKVWRYAGIRRWERP